MTVCKRAGCRKKAHPLDEFCSRTCARLHHCGEDTRSSAGSLTLAVPPSQGGLTALQRLAAVRDRLAREREGVT